jgi:hypothetical protein
VKNFGRKLVIEVSIAEVDSCQIQEDEKKVIKQIVVNFKSHV